MADGSSWVATNRFLFVDTPFRKDTLILRSLTGHEGLSQLFSFTLDLVSESDDLKAEEILGQNVTFGLSEFDIGAKRPFAGIVVRWGQLGQEGRLSLYRAEVVPKFWLLTRRIQSRIFQHLPVPDILKKVLVDLDVDYEIQGNFAERNYCVQYNESDFQFASRLMEEEGIFYFFRHDNGHRMVLANTPQSHVFIAGNSTVRFEDVSGGGRDEERITSWEKIQELRSGKYLLWDHKFELPHKHLEADKPTISSVEAGTVAHKLALGVNEKLEIYEYPGYYAKRFDGVNKSGGDGASDLEKIFEDNKRTTAIRMQQEELPALLIHGESNCRELCSGFKFKLAEHQHADGEYVLTSVTHTANEGGLYSGLGSEGYEGLQDSDEMHYSNSFTCIPVALPYRPPRATPKPVVRGCQTAVVVGPQGEEIFTDKYSRVKIQFHWDREGRNDLESSCWVRVATHWAGKQWGIIHIPRIGQEVVVDFLEGDPDQPLIVGSVYNADMMPPWTLPDNMTQSGIKTRSTKQGAASNCNVIRFEDKKGKEQLYIHAEKNKLETVEVNSHEYVGNDRYLRVKRHQKETIEKTKYLIVQDEQREKIEKNYSMIVNADLKEKVSGTTSLTIGGDSKSKIGGTVSQEIGGKLQQKIGTHHAVEAGQEIHLKAGMKIIIEAGVQVSLKGPGGFVDIGPAGVTIQGTTVLINSGGAAGAGSGCTVQPPDAPDDPEAPEITAEEKLESKE